MTTTDVRSARNIDRLLGERVRQRRLEIGMSQERLADALGITFQQVQKYEKGNNRIAASRLYDIAAALDISVCDFFEGLTQRRSPSREKASAMPESAQLMALFASIPDARARRRLIDLAADLAEQSKK